jgi:hypothetical protein
MAAVSITAEREKEFEFSEPIVQAGLQIMVRSGSDEIKGSEELPGKRIGTAPGSTAAAFLRTIDAQIHEFGTIKYAAFALLDKTVDAIVYDAPVLLHYAAQAGKGRVQVIGPLLQKEDYGIVFPQNMTLTAEPGVIGGVYWNADSTRMPTRMHSFYLRNMYHRNVLKDPGGISLANVPIDLTKIEVTIYFLSTREDHIAPWRSTYAGTQLVSGPVRFVLGASGHIAGVINPPSATRYGYWTGGALAVDPAGWLERAEYHSGSWWTDWTKWISRHGGGQVSARQPGSGKLAAIEDAPGSYVKVRDA